MNIFITGAAGYIGGSVAHSLLSAGHTIRGLVRSPEKVEHFAASGVTPVFGNLNDHDLFLGPVQSWTVEKATREWGEGHDRYSFGSNSRVRARRARRELGWAPLHASLTQWIEQEMPVA